MKGTELRIGNLVNFKGVGIVTLCAISEDGIRKYSKDGKLHCSASINSKADYGIDLTQDLVSSLGFQKSLFHFLNKKWVKNKVKVKINELKYHQLQNLYFALTKEELPNPS